MKKLLKLTPLCILALALAVFLFVLTGTLIKHDVLTLIYYDDFKNAHNSNTMLAGEMEYFKVLSCSDEKAEVYYVSKDMSMANVLTFEKQDGAWSEIRWDTIWSASGSASEVIWPYWWHFIYGGL